MKLTPRDYLLHYGDCYYWGIAASSIGIIGNIALQNKVRDGALSTARACTQYACAACRDSRPSLSSAILPRSRRRRCGQMVIFDRASNEIGFADANCGADSGQTTVGPFTRWDTASSYENN